MRKLFLPLLLSISSIPALAQWQAVSNPVPLGSQLWGSQFDAVNGQTAWFTNHAIALQISRTVDGGQNWQNVGPMAPLVGRYVNSSLEAFDGQHAWLMLRHTDAAGYNPVTELHYTADGGATWGIRPLPTVQPRQNMLRFFSVTEGILLDDVAGILYRTTDGGLTWQLQNTTPVLPVGQVLLGMHEADGILWADVYNTQLQPVAFWASTDHGLTWRSQSLPVATGAVVFRDAQHALLPAPQGGMLSSLDGGLTWQNATAPPFRRGPLTAVPGTRAYVAGADHWIGITSAKGSAVTHDDGQTWTMFESSNSYQSILFTGPEAGWHIRASFAPPTATYEYEGIGRYTGSPLAARATNTPVVTADVFPNPSASGLFTVRLPAAAGSVSAVRVLNALGRVVYQAAALPADQRLDLSQQHKGVYSLEVQTTTGVVRRKLVTE